MTNTKKMDNIQSGMKSNKKVHKDLFKMMKFCAAFCCLLLCTVVNVQAQGVNEGTPRLVITDPSSKTYRYGANTGATTTGNNRIRFNLGGVGVTGWEHTIRYTHPGTYFSINPADFLIKDGSISVSLNLGGVNAGAERSAVIVFSTVGGATTAMDSITLTQAGRIQPTISVSPSSRTVGADGVDATVFGFNAFTISVSDVIPSDNLVGGVAWRTSITGDDVGFLRLVPNGNASVTSDAPIQTRGIIVDLNPTEDERTAVISFFTVVGGNVTVADTARVTITQMGRVGAVPPRVTPVNTADTIFMDRNGGPPTVTLSFDVQYGSWSAMSEGFLTLSNLNVASEGDCSTSRLCAGGAVDATKRRLQFSANGSAYSGSDRRTASVTITATGADTITSKVITIIQRGLTTLNITPNLDTLVVGGSTSMIDFTTNGTWTAMSSESFITLSPTMGTGDATITATADENTGSFRTATISITSVGIDGTRTRTTTVSQAAAALVGDPPTLDITSVLDTLGHDNGSTITIGFGTDADWTATSDESFIRLSPTSGDSSDAAAAEITATAASANTTGMLRTATITITSIGLGGITTRRITVSQEAVPTVRITGPTASPSAPLPNHMSTSISRFIFNVGGSAKGWTSNINYRPAGADFITFSGGAMNPTQTGTVTKTINVSENTGAARTAEIVITTTGSKGTSVSDRLTLTQPAAPATLVVATNDTTVDHNSGDFVIPFELRGTAVGWTAVITGGFITLDPAGPNTTATGEVSVTATYEENDTGSDRMATITFTASGGATDMVTITQSAEPAPENHTLMFTSDSTVNLPYNATTAENITFTLGNGAEGWTATSTNMDFITVPSSGTTGVIMVTVVGTPSGSRTAKIGIMTTGATGVSVTDTVTITQAGAPPTLVVSVPTLQEGNNDTTIAYNAIINAFDIIEFTVGGGAERWIADVIDGDDANDFLTLVSDEGDAGGTNTISVTVVENTGGERMDTVVITTVGGTGVLTDTIIVTQEAVPTIAVTSPDEITIDHDVTDEQTITFNVGGSATGWRVTSNHDSITLSPTSGSSGTGQVMATFTENRDVLRAATITIITTGQLGDSVTAEVTITQTGAPGSPTLDITTPSSDPKVVGYADTATTDSVEIVFTVGGGATGWESMISYGDGVDEFVTLSDTVNAAQTDTVRIKAAVMENEGVKRIAMLTLSTTGQSGFSAATREIIIVQSGAPPTFMLTSANIDTIAHNAETARDITFNVGGGATGWSSNIVYTPDVNSGGEEFITLTGEKDMRGDITVTVASRVNTGIERSAVITIATVGGTGDALNTMITITQRAAPVNPPTLIVSTNDTTISHDATDAFEISFTLGGDARGWQSTSTGDDFITLTPEQNTTATGKVTIMATASVNATGSERMQTITFVTTGGVTDMITITQRAAPPAAAPTISISTMDTTIEASATTAAINLVFTVGGSAMGWSSNVVYTPAGANFITFTPTQNANEKGEVTIKVTPAANTKARRVAKIVITPTGGTGTAVSDSITITQKTGEEETDLGISLDESLTLYPNPTDGLFFIEGLSGALEVHVHDLLGRQVATYSLSAGERNVDVSALSSGMYVVTLKESGGELLTRILIKQ